MEDAAAVEKLLGKDSASELLKLVDFAKEKVVLVNWSTSGPPEGSLKHEVTGAGKERRLDFYVQGPAGATIRGMRAKIAADFFAVPKDIPVAFDAVERELGRAKPTVEEKAMPDTVSRPTNVAPKKGLASFKVDGNSMSPKGGMDLPGARKLIIGRLEKDGVKGDIDPAAKISEITTKESWESAGIQLYSVRVDYAWLDGVAVVRNKECMAVLNGRVVFLADLDKDDRYEIYTNFERGSGIISLDILGYNIALKEKYSLSMRFKKDLELFIENGALMARLHPPQQNRENNAPVGKVILKINRGKRELAIE